MIHNASRTPESKLLTLLRPVLDYCAILCSSMRKSNGLDIENVQQTFIKRLPCYSSLLNYMGSCTKLLLLPLLPHPVQINLPIFHKISGKHACVSAFQVGHNFSYVFRCTEFLVLVPKPRRAFRIKLFINKFSSLWRKLPQHRRMISPASTALKIEIWKTVVVQNLLNLHSRHTSMERVYESGLGY